MKSIFLILTVVVLGIAACDSPQNTTGSGTDSTSINNNNMNTDTTSTSTQPQPTQPDTSQNR